MPTDDINQPSEPSGHSDSGFDFRSADAHEFDAPPERPSHLPPPPPPPSATAHQRPLLPPGGNRPPLPRTSRRPLPPPVAKRKTSPASVAVLILVVLGYVAVRINGGLPTPGPSGPSSPTKPLALNGPARVAQIGDVAPFRTDATPANLDPVQQRQLDQLIDDLADTLMGSGRVAPSQVFDYESMIQAMVARTPPSLQARLRAQLGGRTGFASGFMRGFSTSLERNLETARQLRSGLGPIVHRDIHKVVTNADGNLIVWVRVFQDDGESETLSRIIVWVVRDPRTGMRIYDLMDVDDQSQLTVTGAAGLVQISKSGASLANIQRLSNKFTNVMRRMAVDIDSIQVGDVDELLNAQDLLATHPTLRFIRFAIMVRHATTKTEIRDAEVYASRLTDDPGHVPTVHQVWGDWLMRRAAAADHDVELYGRAAGHYRRYIDMVGPDPESSFSLGNALTWLDDYKGAVAAYREWVDVSYRVGPCHRNLAEFGCDGGESVLAASMMLQLLDTREYAADVPELLADSFDNIDGTDDPDGVRALLKVLDRIGDAAPPDLQLKRGQALLELDDMPAARAFWISVLQGLWADDNARQQAMRMLVYNEGASDLLRALGGLPEKPVGAWYYAGLAHNKLGDAAAAREAFVAGFRTGDAPDLRNAALRQLNFMNRPDDVVSLLTALPVGQRPAACWNAHFDALRKLQRRSDIPAAAREYAADPSIPAEDVIDMLDSVIKVPGGADAVINLLAGWSANRSDEPGAIATVTRGDALLHLGREREALDLWAACALDSAADEQVRGTALARIRQRQQWELLGSVVQKLTDNASTLDSSVERYLVLRHAGKTEEAGELAMTCARDSKQWQCAAWLRRAIACNQPRRVLRFLEFAADQVSNANPSWIKAQASAATGKPSDALPLYRAALRASSGGTPPGILDVPGGPEMVIEEIDAMPSEQREQFRGLASNALCKLRQFDEASRIWSDLLAKADTYGWQRESALRALLGVQLEADPARAIATAKAAMQKEPDDLDLQIRLAILYVRAGKIAEAGALLDEMRRADDERITTLATWRTWDDSWDDVRVLWNQPELGPRLKKWYLDVTGGKLSLLPHDDLD